MTNELVETPSVICFGDSITAGDFVPHSCCWVSLLDAVLKVEGFSAINCGRGGDTSIQGLARFNAEVKPLLPATVLIQFGYNDSKIIPGRNTSQVSVADYIRTIYSCVHSIQECGGAALVLINYLPDRPIRNTGNGRSYNENFTAYDQALREAIKRNGWNSIDMQEVSVPGALCEDGLHLTIAGHRRFADILRKALPKSLPHRFAHAHRRGVS